MGTWNFQFLRNDLLTTNCVFNLVEVSEIVPLTCCMPFKRAANVDVPALGDDACC